MENKNLTAVDWLFEMLIDNKYLIKDATHLFQQAKQMEKEQIEDAFQDGKWDWAEHITKGIESKDLAQYYKETYGK